MQPGRVAPARRAVAVVPSWWNRRTDPTTGGQMTDHAHQVSERIGPGSVSVTRTGSRTYEGMNERGSTVRIGPADAEGHFTPGELLKLALVGCTGMSSDRVAAQAARRRLRDHHLGARQVGPRREPLPAGRRGAPHRPVGSRGRRAAEAHRHHGEGDPARMHRRPQRGGRHRARHDHRRGRGLTHSPRGA